MENLKSSSLSTNQVNSGLKVTPEMQPKGSGNGVKINDTIIQIFQFGLVCLGLKFLDTQITADRANKFADCRKRDGFREEDLEVLTLIDFKSLE